MAPYTSAGYLQRGNLIGDSFRLLRAHFWPFVVVASAFLVPLGLLDLALGQVSVMAALNELSQTGLEWQSVATILGSSWAWGLAAGLVVSALVKALLAGVMVRMAAQVIDGEPHHLLDAVRYAARRWPRIVLARLLLAGAAIFALVAPLGCVMLIVSPASSDGSSPLAVPLLILGVLVTIVVIVALIPIAIRLGLVTQGIIVEDQGTVASIRRSWELTRGEIWRLIGYAIVLVIVILPVELIVGLLVAAVPLIEPVNIGDWIATPFNAIANTLIFYGLRAEVERYTSKSAPATPALGSAKAGNGGPVY